MEVRKERILSFTLHTTHKDKMDLVFIASRFNHFYSSKVCWLNKYGILIPSFKMKGQLESKNVNHKDEMIQI